jgi:hypothetical protein
MQIISTTNWNLKEVLLVASDLQFLYQRKCASIQGCLYREVRYLTYKD